MTTTVALYREGRRSVCIICISGGSHEFSDINSLREKAVAMARHHGFEPHVIAQKIVDCPIGFLCAKERTMRTLMLASIRGGGFAEVWVAGAILSEFAREAVLATRTSGTCVRFYGNPDSPLGKYGKWFKKEGKKTAQAQRA